MSINIAIDGPSGSGKSTLAKRIAKRLGINYLDTGSMYRAAAYAAVQSGVDARSEAEVDALMSDIDLKTVYVRGEQHNLFRGQNVMPYIRTPEISTAASDISAHPSVRHKLVAMQRDVAKNYDLVLDGRDIGTFVLPDAKYKFFVTADIKERAKRRHLELQQRGTPQPYEDVLGEMRERDYNDTNRALAPLMQASDAVLIDTTKMTIEDAVNEILRRIEQE